MGIIEKIRGLFRKDKPIKIHEDSHKLKHADRYDPDINEGLIQVADFDMKNEMFRKRFQFLQYGYDNSGRPIVYFGRGNVHGIVVYRHIEYGDRYMAGNQGKTQSRKTFHRHRQHL